MTGWDKVVPYYSQLTKTVTSCIHLLIYCLLGINDRLLIWQVNCLCRELMRWPMLKLKWTRAVTLAWPIAVSLHIFVLLTHWPVPEMEFMMPFYPWCHKENHKSCPCQLGLIWVNNLCGLMANFHSNCWSEASMFLFYTPSALEWTTSASALYTF